MKPLPNEIMRISFTSIVTRTASTSRSHARDKSSIQKDSERKGLCKIYFSFFSQAFSINIRSLAKWPGSGAKTIIDIHSVTKLYGNDYQISLSVLFVCISVLYNTYIYAYGSHSLMFECTKCAYPHTGACITQHSPKYMTLAPFKVHNMLQEIPHEQVSPTRYDFNVHFVYLCVLLYGLRTCTMHENIARSWYWCAYSGGATYAYVTSKTYWLERHF